MPLLAEVYASGMLLDLDSTRHYWKLWLFSFFIRVFKMPILTTLFFLLILICMLLVAVSNAQNESRKLENEEINNREAPCWRNSPLPPPLFLFCTAITFPPRFVS